MSKRFLTAALVMASALPALAEQSFLLRESFANPGRATSAFAKAKRRRLVEPDFAVLSADLNRGQRKKLERLLTVQLFPDTTLLVTLGSAEKNDIDATVWTGVIDGDPLSSVVIAVKDATMTATFSTLDRHYQVHPAGNGTHESVELDRGDFPAELEPVRADAFGAAGGPVTADESVSADAAGTWDVLVAYTANARANYGGTSAIQTLISNAVGATNAAYANSRVTSRLRLAGTMEVDYPDTANGYGTTLTRLQGMSDGYMDAIHTQRNAVGADAVSLVIWGATEGACGVGYVMQTPSASFASSAFNVTRYDCAVGNLSFAHELGHNFGLEHDRANASAPGAYPYAYGYQNPSGLFRDVMAYNCPSGCPRIQYFSNPDVLYNGNPTGVYYLASNAADNARALNDNASTIANWRQAVTTTPTPTPQVTFTNDPLVAGSTLVKAIHITELRTAINNKRTAAGLAAQTSWSPVAAGSRISATHVLELRNALTPALTVAPSYTALGAGGVIRAVHVQELRTLVR